MTALLRTASAAAMAVLLGACMVGPKYQRPPAPTPSAFKEPLPEGWKEAQPNDGALRGKWWEIYGDATLNSLEDRINVSNQNLLAAEAQYRAARDAIRAAKAALFPTVSAGTAIATSRTSTAGLSGTTAQSTVRSSFQFPFIDFSWEADVWGSIRRSIQASAEATQVTAAQLENARLSLQAQLATAYFELHGLDGDIELLETTVKMYMQARERLSLPA